MQARRATVEDLPQLLALWQLERLDVADLEKHFTEFQVVVEGDEVLGTVGLRLLGTEALLYGESVARPEIGDAVRDLLWQRLKTIARNHSVDRIWTMLNPPFWKSLGFRPAANEEFASAPEFIVERGRAWQILVLRSPEAGADFIEKQFAMLRALHAGEAEKLQRKVSTVKKLAIVLTVIVSLLVIAFAVVVFVYGPRFMKR
jgi:N-acetylglutamate synthase-like GNAT family acetyltransferase